LCGGFGWLLIFVPMAKRSKAKQSQSTEPDKLKPEKEEKVTFRQVIGDERTHKITGAFFLLLAIFLFTAFVSYLFNWQTDQSIAKNGASILAPSSDAKASNLLGNFGAYISYKFFYGLGLTSFFICSFFFTAGANLLFAKKIFSIVRNLRYVIVGILFCSVVLAFITKGASFSWGGAMGEMISDWLTRIIGWVGTAALLLVGGLAYIIWRFNPVFKVPKLPARKTAPTPDGDVPAETEDAQEDDGPKLFIERPAGRDKGNILKREGGIVVIPPTPEKELSGGMDLLIREVPEEKKPIVAQEVDIPVAKIEKPQKPAIKPETALELEIKTALEVRSENPGESFADPTIPAALPDYEPTLDLQNYKYPSLDLLATHGNDKIIQDAGELEANKNQIIGTLKNYDIDIQKISATVGPTVTLYEIVPAAGVRISRIKNLEDDIALNLSALGIRIIAPIPGKGTIGIEVPNVKKTVVSMRTLLASEKFQHSYFNLPIAIGKKIDNENFIVDLTAMPHLLMAGATGQGKSVGLNAILVSLLYKKHPSQLKFVLVDPKKVELSLYRLIEKHFLAKLPGEEEAIITDTKKVIHTLNALCIEMDNRYDLLKEAGARNIKEYNDKFIKRRLNPQKGHQYLPFIVLVIDEFADLIMTAGKEVEMPMARLAQLARAVGIHLIIATQRPSVNIITGTIKANFPARIAFKVSSKIDSRTILDTGGAEQLIGKGDMLVSYNGEITRLQCAFVDTPEVEEIVEFIGRQQGYPQAFLLPEYIDEKDAEGRDFDLADRDPLFEEAARLIVQNQIGSTSLLQRRMKLGYNRAGRLMDQLEASGVVGPNQGSKARDVLIKTEMELDHYLETRS